MKKGFIERIEDDNVYIIYEDKTMELFKLDKFKQPIKIDMVVEVDGENINVFPPSEETKREINKITNKIFVSFKDRKKK